MEGIGKTQEIAWFWLLGQEQVWEAVWCTDGSSSSSMSFWGLNEVKEEVIVVTVQCRMLRNLTGWQVHSYQGVGRVGM